MAAAYGSILDRMVAEGFAPPAQAHRGEPPARPRRASAIRRTVSLRAVHVIGAGVAGLSAAVRFAEAGLGVTVHEAAQAAGGRCRSYADQALGLTIDNGNHLLLSGNRAALDYLDRIGARGTLRDPGAAIFDFADLASGERWRLRLNEGRLPWWLFDSHRRVPGTAFQRLSGAARGVPAAAGRDSRPGDALRGRLYERLWRPLFSSPRSTPSRRKAPAALTAALLRETLAAGEGPAIRCSRPWPCAELHRSGACLSCCARRRCPLRRAPAGHPLRGEPRRRPRFRRRSAGARSRRFRPPRRPAMGRAGPVARPRTPDDFRGILNVAFPRLAAARPAGDPWRRERDDRVVVRLPGPALGHDQQRRPTDRQPA